MQLVSTFRSARCMLLLEWPENSPVCIRRETSGNGPMEYCSVQMWLLYLISESILVLPQLIPHSSCIGG